MRILIQNSDSPHNRGDRAILVGVIELVRERWPGAEIWALSQYPERDEKWFGIRFLDQSPYSTSPREWARLARFARESDLVLFGGGEILKDYTNRLGLVYWLLKTWMLRRANPNLVGVFQGIGPTTTRFGRWAIRRTVDLTRAFIVRDGESKVKLEAWGVRTPVIESVDPAVLGVPRPPAADLGELEPRLDGAVGFGVRRWFHYRPAGWLPNRFRPQQRDEDPRVERYRRSLAQAADRMVEATGKTIVFLPMHLEASEGDAQFSREVIALMRYPDAAVVVEADDYASEELAGIMSRLSVMLASRLHSAILATTASVPTFVLYYVDKGRLFFEQLGFETHAAPIEAALEPDAGEWIADNLLGLMSHRSEVRRSIAVSLDAMQEQLRISFSTALSYLEDYDEELARAVA